MVALLRGRCSARVNAEQDTSQRDLRTAPDAATEGKFINPVCGVAVSTDYPTHSENSQGVSYYFCCDSCRTTFQQDPAKYAAIHRASVGRVAV